MAAAKNIRPSSLSAIISALYTHSLASLIASLTHPSWSQPVTEFTHNFFTRTKSLGSGRGWGWTRWRGKCMGRRPWGQRGSREAGWVSPVTRKRVWQLRSVVIKWVSWGEGIGCGGGGGGKCCSVGGWEGCGGSGGASRSCYVTSATGLQVIQLLTSLLMQSDPPLDSPSCSFSQC